MSVDIWDGMLTEKGFLRVPRALRLKRAELGLTNNEYTILLDYVDYYAFCRTENPYRHLSEVNGVSERSIRRALAGLEAKGLVSRRVLRRSSGRIIGVVFSLDPLVRRLASIMKKPSHTGGEGNVTYAGEESITPNTREEFTNREESENTRAVRAGSAAGSDCETGRRGSEDSCGEGAGSESGIDRPGGKAGQIQSAATDADRSPARSPAAFNEGGAAYGGRGEASPAGWYDREFAPLYEAAAGQPVLRGGREYRAAATYFRRLAELNPGLSAEGVRLMASRGARYMIVSQMEGGVFGWMHKPPDVCALAAQAQAVDYHLRRETPEGGGGEDCGLSPKGFLPVGAGTEGDAGPGFIERIEEAHHAREQDSRLFGELRGIERASRERTRAFGQGGQAVHDESGGGEAEEAHPRGALVPGRG